MFSVGEYVVYGENGVCRIEKIGHPMLRAADEGTEYYFLRPTFYTGVIYAPVGTRVPMRALISYEEARELLSEISATPACVLVNRDRKALAAQYAEMLAPNTCASYLQAVRCILAKRAANAGTARMVSAAEEQILKKAETCLYEELAIALHISQEDARAEVEKRILA